MNNMKKIGSAVGVALLCGVAAQADVYSAQNGDGNLGSTWVGGIAPVATDTETWAVTNSVNFPGVDSRSDTFHGETLRVADGGILSGDVGLILTVNNVTLDGGRITVLNNSPFTLNLAGKNLNLNSGTLDSGGVNTGRDLIFANAVWAGSGTIYVEGGASAARSAVIFNGAGHTTSGFTGMFEVKSAANFYLPAIAAADASFGVKVTGSGQLALTENIAVTKALLGNVAGDDVIDVPLGTYTRDQLLALGVNQNRILAAGADSTLTVIPEPATLGLIASAGLGILFIRRQFML